MNPRNTYRGFALSDIAFAGGISAHAQHLDEAGEWKGAGFVGSMPDRDTMRAYIDWLHDVGPAKATAFTIPIDAPTGHVVTVNGNQSDDAAHVLDRLAEIPDRIADPQIPSDDLRRVFGEFVWIIRLLEIAQDGKRSAWRVENFFVTAADGDSRPSSRLHLGNFGAPGDWNGSGSIAVGLGDGWVRPLVKHLLSKPFSNTGLGNVVPAAPTSTYARNVFVEGPEPVLSDEAIAQLKAVESLMSAALSPGPSMPHRQQNVRNAAKTLRDLVEHLEAHRQAQTAPTP